MPPVVARASQVTQIACPSSFNDSSKSDRTDAYRVGQHSQAVERRSIDNCSDIRVKTECRRSRQKSEPEATPPSVVADS